LQARVDVIEKADVWRVGNGHLIHIWEDNWLPYQNSHKIWSPKPSNCDIMFVSDLIHDDIRCWNAPLINETFLPFEAQQILQLPISFSQSQDEFVWGASQCAIFSVKSAYRFLKARRDLLVSHNSVQDIDQQVWKKLWKIKSIPRHIHFAWRILHEKLPLKNDLFKKRNQL